LFRPRYFRRLFFCFGRNDRKSYVERCADADFTLEPDFTTMRFNKGFGDGHSQAGAGGFGQIVFGLLKTLAL
jgi:hypothetical protein